MKTNSGMSKATVYCWGYGMKEISQNSGRMSNGPRHTGNGSKDPYEFNDENHATSVKMNGLKRKEEKKKVIMNSDL